jgi:hypothetical protein
MLHHAKIGFRAKREVLMSRSKMQGRENGTK